MAVWYLLTTAEAVLEVPLQAVAAEECLVLSEVVLAVPSPEVVLMVLEAGEILHDRGWDFGSWVWTFSEYSHPHCGMSLSAEVGHCRVVRGIQPCDLLYSRGTQCFVLPISFFSSFRIP